MKHAYAYKFKGLDVELSLMEGLLPNDAIVMSLRQLPKVDKIGAMSKTIESSVVELPKEVARSVYDVMVQLDNLSDEVLIYDSIDFLTKSYERLINNASSGMNQERLIGLEVR